VACEHGPAAGAFGTTFENASQTEDVERFGGDRAVRQKAREHGAGLGSSDLSPAVKVCPSPVGYFGPQDRVVLGPFHDEHAVVVVGVLKPDELGRPEAEMPEDGEDSEIPDPGGARILGGFVQDAADDLRGDSLAAMSLDSPSGEVILVQAFAGAGDAAAGGKGPEHGGPDKHSAPHAQAAGQLPALGWGSGDPLGVGGNSGLKVTPEADEVFGSQGVPIEVEGILEGLPPAEEDDGCFERLGHAADGLLGIACAGPQLPEVGGGVLDASIPVELDCVHVLILLGSWVLLWSIVPLIELGAIVGGSQNVRE